jgi:hypothetical protein
MSSPLDHVEVLPFRRAAEFATDTATALGEGFEAIITPSGSTELPKEELAIGVVDFEAAEEELGMSSRKTLWYLVSRQRNELVHFTRFQAAEEQLGYPAQPTASATELAELWRPMETLLTQTDPAFRPSRTELGRKLREIRRRYLLRGGRLMTADEIDEEIAFRRGERDQEEG